MPLLNTPATNALAKVNKRDIAHAQIDRNDAALITRGDLQVLVQEYSTTAFALRPSAQRLLDALVSLYTADGAKTRMQALSVTEYSKLCSLTDYKSTKQQLIDDAQSLSWLRISHKDVGTSAFINLFSSGAVNEGAVVVNFTEEFCALLQNKAVMPLPKEYFCINLHKHPNSQAMLRYILENKRINAGRSRADVIPVPTLLAVCPSIPSKDEAGKRVQQRIITPFMRDLDAINEVYCPDDPLFEWNFITTDGKSADYGEPGTPLPCWRYSYFIGLRIKITWLRYPDQTALLEGRRTTQRARKHRRKK